MKYTRVIVPRRGGPDVLRFVEEDLPEPRPGEVRVKMQAAGVSLADVLMREGVHPETPLGPFTPGWDVAGVVDQVGAGVTAVQPGQPVAALIKTGGYAEYLCLPQKKLIPVPAGLDPAEVVSVVFNYCTAYQAMHRSARVQAGETVLIHSAAGGVGTALLQLGRLAGLEMYGTASAAKHGVVESLGGVPFDYRTEDFVAAVRRHTGGRGVHVVFDGIGGASLRRSYRALRQGGRLIAYGLAAALEGGRSGVRRVLHTYGHLLTIFALNAVPDMRRVRLYSIQNLRRLRPDWFRVDEATLFTLLAEGQIKPIVAARLPLREAVRAHELLGSGAVVGKIVLVSE